MSIEKSVLRGFALVAAAIVTVLRRQRGVYNFVPRDTYHGWNTDNELCLFGKSIAPVP